MKLLHETMTNFLVFTSYKVFFLDSLPRIEARQVEELRAFEAYIATPKFNGTHRETFKYSIREKTRGSS
ncbi:hypothetical protein DRN46_06755 [Thermococci archaeon]|nr:MAG: hypothetical protein DRN46_06755 [Thermococci archaeon]